MKDFKFLSNNDSKGSPSDQMETNNEYSGFCITGSSIYNGSIIYPITGHTYNIVPNINSKTTISQSLVKSIIDDDYELMNDPYVVDHIQGFILKIYLFGIVITGLVKFFSYAGF